jgi:hypothetical protein
LCCSSREFQGSIAVLRTAPYEFAGFLEYRFLKALNREGREEIPLSSRSRARLGTTARNAAIRADALQFRMMRDFAHV